MPEIIIRPLALEDLADIWDYIAEDSQARADAFIDSIDMKINELAGSPHAGRSRMELLPGLLPHRPTGSSRPTGRRTRSVFTRVTKATSTT